MDHKIYMTVLFTVLAVCVILTAVLIAYTAEQYETVSIIRFIARERW